MLQKNFTSLVKLLSGELNLFQRFAVRLKLLLSPQLRKEYKILRQIWHKLDYENPRKLNIHTDHWEENRWGAYIKLAIAASVAAFIGIYMLLSPNTNIIQNTTGQIQIVWLPDGSQVILDTNATLIYTTSKLKGFDRQVRLKGRAFFSVKHDAQKSFIVHTLNLDVKVLGTKFNVQTSKDRTQVTLVEGKVKLLDFSHLDTCVILKPNYTAIYSVPDNKLTLKQTNTRIQTYWLDKRIEFKNYNLQDIAKIFQIYYGKHLKFDDSLLKYKRIGGSAPTDNYMLIVRALAYITHSDYQIVGDTIYFKHKKP